MTAVKCWAEKTNFPAKFECLFPEYPNDISVLLQSFMVENTTERRDGGRGGGGGSGAEGADISDSYVPRIRASLFLVHNCQGY